MTQGSRLGASLVLLAGFAGAAGLAGLAASFHACGGGFADGEAPDAGNNGDAGANQCQAFLVPPAQANVGQPVELSVILEGAIDGVVTYSWSIAFLGSQQSITELSDPVDRVSFVPIEAGPYQVVVEVSVGDEGCIAASGDLNVIATGALSTDYRMRIQPAGGAPLQDLSVRIFGGSDSVLPETTLETGVSVSGQIVDAGGSPVPAYLRARERGASVQRDFEAFANAGGSFLLRVPAARFDLMIVPESDALPSRYLENLSTDDLNATIVLPAAVALSGHVFDAAGSPLPGARVSLIVDGARTTEATSTAAGAFSVLGASGQLTGLAVAAPVDLGMPSLRAASLSGQALTPGSDVVIRYAAPLVSAQVAVTLLGGGAAANAKAEWRADLANAGSVDLGLVEVLTGSLRVAATANASGQLQSSLSAVNADLVVTSLDNTEGLVARNLAWGSTPSQAMSLSPLVTAPIAVDASGAPLVARVQATPLDVLAPQVSTPSATTDVDGNAALGLVRGGNYLLTASDTRQGSTSLTILNAQPGLPSTDLLLPGTVIAKGQLKLSSGIAAGAQVTLYCSDCLGADATVARASAVSDGAGRYVLRVPDPGVASP